MRNANPLQTHAAEIGSEIRKRRYEVADSGVLLPRMGLFIGGAMLTRLYRGGEQVDAAQIDANKITNEGLNHILNAALPPEGGYPAITQWYVAPFSGNYTPDAVLTAATFPAAATEFTGYTAATRPLLDINSAATAQTTGNAGNEASITLAEGGPYNLYGAALLSASAKGATTGKCLAAVRFDNPRLNLSAGDRLGLEYVLTATDAG